MLVGIRHYHTDLPRCECECYGHWGISIGYLSESKSCHCPISAVSRTISCRYPPCFPEMAGPFRSFQTLIYQGMKMSIVPFPMSLLLAPSKARSSESHMRTLALSVHMISATSLYKAAVKFAHCGHFFKGYTSLKESRHCFKRLD